MKSSFLWLVFLLLTFVVTLPISWWGMAKVDFFYASLHDSIGIDTHIERYAPRNQFNKKEFEKTPKSERVALFHGVVEAIHNKGEGLDSLAYIRASNKEKVTLFTEAEVIHLKDVAILIDRLKPIVIGAIFIWLVIVSGLFKRRIQLPSAKRFSMLSLVLLVSIVLILSFGPAKVFNQLHVWVFPDDHQWFFYYEESLMSTMMKAPHLFGYISAIWAVISIVLTIVLLRFLHLFNNVKR